MKGLRIFPIVILIVSICTISFAQKDDEKLAELKRMETALLDEVLEDANNLKLPENRALVYAHVGNKIWDTDEKNARKLFEQSIIEIIKAQQEAEVEQKNTQNLTNLLYGQNPRLQILNIIANRDAEFALDSLYRSRPSKLIKVLNKHSTDQQPYRYSHYNSFAITELQSEQLFINLAAKQNPERFVELFRQSLKKGVNYETLNLLQEIHKKDSVLANKLADEAVQALLKTQINPNNSNQYIYSNFIDRFGRIEETDQESQLKISNSLFQELVDKLSASWLNSPNQHIDINSNVFKYIDKLFPSRALLLKEKQQKLLKQNENQNPENKRYNEFIKTNPSAEEMLKQTKNFSSYRYSIYETALRKLADEGNIEQLKTVLENNLQEDEANQRLAQFYTNLASAESSKGNFEEAYNLIRQIPVDESRFLPLIHLANSIYSKNPEKNKQYALTILREAETLIAANTDNQIEINKLINLANSYAQIEPAQSFSLIARAINPLNEFSKASAVVSQFNGQGRVRNGEFLISMGIDATGQFNIGYIFQNLKNADFDQTIQLINRFEQIETRISLKLQMINGSINLPINTTRFVNFSSNGPRM